MEDLERRKHNLQQAICSIEFLIEIETDPEKIARYNQELEGFRRQINNLAQAAGA